MGHVIFLTVFFLLVGLTDILRAEEVPNAKFMGISKCASSGCHGSAKLGNQKAPWEESTHAKATSDLSGKKGKEFAGKLNVANPAQSDLCLSCHSTAFGVKEELLAETFDPEEGVQCEACHGAGSEFIEPHKKKGAVYEEIVEKGMRPLKTVQQQKDLCATCHGAKDKYEKLKKSGHPELDKVSFEEGMKKIKHWQDKKN